MATQARESAPIYLNCKVRWPVHPASDRELKAAGIDPAKVRSAGIRILTN